MTAATVRAGAAAALGLSFAMAACCLTFDGSRFACDDGGTDCPPEAPSCVAGFCVSANSTACIDHGQSCGAGDTCCASAETCHASGQQLLCCAGRGAACDSTTACCAGSCTRGVCP